jgi:hypothetical protein
MTRDDIIRIYSQVSDELCHGTEWCWAGVGEPLQRFTDLVAAAERQAIIDEFQKWHRSDKDRHSHWLHVINYIQGRGQA